MVKLVMRNMSYKNYSYDDCEIILKKAINDEIPIVVKIDGGCLGYNSIFHLSKDIQVTHFVNLIGFDYKFNRLLISDGYVPTDPPSMFEGWLDYDLGMLKNK